MIGGIVDLFVKIGLWLSAGYILLLVNVKLDPDAAELIQENEKLVALLVILWPWMIVSMAITALGKNRELVDLLYKIRDKLIKVI